MEDWREVGRRISGDVRTSASAITDGKQPKRTFTDRVQRLHVLGLLLEQDVDRGDDLGLRQLPAVQLM
jgi:hypothetical protein